MKCPHCSDANSRVIDTRATGDGIRRRRECENCGKRFTTYEHVAASLLIIKSDGRREPFDRQKLMHGILTACAKRPISQASIEDMVDTIEEELAAMRPLDVSRLPEFKEEQIQVSERSTIRVKHCAYSVPSRLIGETLRVRVYEDRIEAEYDPSIFLFDMPPMFVSDDAMAVMGQMDCVLIIAAAESTKIKEIDRCERELAAQTNVLGVVLNKCRYMEGEGYGYDYYGG